MGGRGWSKLYWFNSQSCSTDFHKHSKLQKYSWLTLKQPEVDFLNTLRQSLQQLGVSKKYEIILNILSFFIRRESL